MNLSAVRAGKLKKSIVIQLPGSIRYATAYSRTRVASTRARRLRFRDGTPPRFYNSVIVSWPVRVTIGTGFSQKWFVPDEMPRILALKRPLNNPVVTLFAHFPPPCPASALHLLT